MAWLGWAWFGLVRQDKGSGRGDSPRQNRNHPMYTTSSTERTRGTRPGTARSGRARRGLACCGMAWRGTARQGKLNMPKKRQQNEMWDATRLRVMERDAYRCVRCGGCVGIETAHIDHIVPISHPKGTNEMGNLRTLCRRCHVLRADNKHRGMIASALRDGIIPSDWRGLIWD